MAESEDSDLSPSEGPRSSTRRSAPSAVKPAPEQFAWIEQVASRYFSIWVWSIVVGVSTSTTLSLTNYLVRSKGSFVNLLMAPLFMLSAVSLLAGWWGTIRFFDTFILKLFMGERPFPSEPPGALEEREAYERYHAGKYLRMAVRYAFIGLAFRLMLSLADILLSSMPY